MSDPSRAALAAALRWQIEAGAVDAFAEEPGVRSVALLPFETLPPTGGGLGGGDVPHPVKPDLVATAPPSNLPPAGEKVLKAATPTLTSATAAQSEAASLAAAATTLDDLRASIAAFEHIGLKHIAKNLVFADGNPQADIMIVGEAPGADEDIQGKPFVGASGQLLDKIFALIGRDRRAEEPDKALYITNILNWRPPGNRTPTPDEIALSLPFVERHIALVAPRLLILTGGVSAKALLRTESGITKLRGRWRDYSTADGRVIPLLATYHPSYLLRTPTQKKAVWQDMLAVQDKLRTI